MSHTSPSPSPIEMIESLFLRYDGPLPTEAMEGLLAGGRVRDWRSRALSSEIDRAARDLSALIAARRASLADLPGRAPGEDSMLAALVNSLGDCRGLGLRYTCFADNSLDRRTSRV